MPKKKRLSWRAQKALQIIAEHPDWSDNKVGVEMMRLGICKDRSYLSKLIWKEKYPAGKKPISEPWRRYMLRYHGTDPQIWNKYHKEDDEI